MRIAHFPPRLSFPTYSGSGQSLADGVICKERIVEDCADCRIQAISVAGNKVKAASYVAWGVFGALALEHRTSLLHDDRDFEVIAEVEPRLTLFAID